MMRRTTILALVLVLGACGSKEVRGGDYSTVTSTTIPASTASSAIQPASSAAASTTNTTEGKANTDPKVRAKVLALRNILDAKYKAEIDELRTAGLLPAEKDPDEQRIDDSITGACQAEARGFRASEEQTAYTLTYMAGPLSRHGHDTAGFLIDIQQRDRNIADLVDCP